MKAQKQGNTDWPWSLTIKIKCIGFECRGAMSQRHLLRPTLTLTSILNAEFLTKFLPSVKCYSKNYECAHKINHSNLHNQLRTTISEKDRTTGLYLCVKRRELRNITWIIYESTKYHTNKDNFSDLVNYLFFSKFSNSKNTICHYEVNQVHDNEYCIGDKTVTQYVIISQFKQFL